jgi:hypothetical protein
MRRSEVRDLWLSHPVGFEEELRTMYLRSPNDPEEPSISFVENCISGSLEVDTEK